MCIFQFTFETNTSRSDKKVKRYQVESTESNEFIITSLLFTKIGLEKKTWRMLMFFFLRHKQLLNISF